MACFLRFSDRLNQPFLQKYAQSPNNVQYNIHFTFLFGKIKNHIIYMILPANRPKLNFNYRSIKGNQG